MTTPDATPALPDLDLRLRRVDGTWHLECRSLDVSAECPHGAGGLHAAARQLQAAANDEAKALAPAAERGILMAAGRRRLARLRAPLTTPTK